MVTRALPHAQFLEMTRPLIGQPISRTWRGYGSAIFFEIGPLSQYESKRRDGERRIHHVGEATLMIEWSWRVEKAGSIAFGSWSPQPQIESGLEMLQNSTIESIDLEGRVPEIVVGFSNKHWLHSSLSVENQPPWNLLWTKSLPLNYKEHWIRCERGKVVLTIKD